MNDDPNVKLVTTVLLKKLICAYSKGNTAVFENSIFKEALKTAHITHLSRHVVNVNHIEINIIHQNNHLNAN